MTMSIRRIAIAAAGLALTAGVIAPSAASASSSAPTGTRSLAEVLLADGNQFDSNSAVVPIANGGIKVYSSHDTDLLLDISGYFAEPGTASSPLMYYPLTPCRVVDTRIACPRPRPSTSGAPRSR